MNNIETSAGAVVFRDTKKGRKYLILQHHYVDEEGYWSFPKGHMEKGETEKEAARREIMEETGISDLSFIPGFQKRIGYFYDKYGRKNFKKVVFFLVEVKNGKVKISYEHQNHNWLSFKKAYDVLTYDNTKKILKEADEFLSKKSL